MSFFTERSCSKCFGFVMTNPEALPSSSRRWNPCLIYGNHVIKRIITFISETPKLQQHVSTCVRRLISSTHIRSRVSRMFTAHSFVQNFVDHRSWNTDNCVTVTRRFSQTVFSFSNQIVRYQPLRLFHLSQNKRYQCLTVASLLIFGL